MGRDIVGTPAALIAGMGYRGFLKTFLEFIQGEKDDYDALLDKAN